MENIPLPYATNLKRATPTLGTMFGAAGYHCAYFGKWHLEPAARPAARELHAEQVRAELGLRLCRDRHAARTRRAARRLNSNGDTTRRAVDFLRSPERAAEPWFCAVNLLNPHDIMYYTSGEAMTRSRRMDFPDALARPPADPFYAADLGYGLLPNYGPKTLLRRPEAAYEWPRDGHHARRARLRRRAHRREFQNYYYHCIRDTDRPPDAAAAGAAGERSRTSTPSSSSPPTTASCSKAAPARQGHRTEPRAAARAPVRPRGARGAASHVDLAPTLLAAAGVPADDRWPTNFAAPRRTRPERACQAGRGRPRGPSGGRHPAALDEPRRAGP